VVRKVVSTKVSEVALAVVAEASEVGFGATEEAVSTTEEEALGIVVATAEEVALATKEEVVLVADKATRMVLPRLMLPAVQAGEVGMAAAAAVVEATTIDEMATVAATEARPAATTKHSADAIEATTTETGIETDTAAVAVVVAADATTTTTRENAIMMMAVTTTQDSGGGIDFALLPFSLSPFFRLGGYFASTVLHYDSSIPSTLGHLVIVVR
jgi:hypothetical protein